MTNKEQNIITLARMIEKGYTCKDIEWVAENFSPAEILRWERKFNEFLAKKD